MIPRQLNEEIRPHPQGAMKVILDHLSVPASIHWMSGGQASGESQRYFYSLSKVIRQAESYPYAELSLCSLVSRILQIA
jgi:hypothetical protein